MSKTGFPSLTALLGLLAVAGYQNRDKLAEMFGSAGQAGAAPGAGAPAGLDRILGGLTGGGGGNGLGGTSSGSSSGGLGGLVGGLAGAGGVGGMLSSGLGELMERFRGAGQEETAKSWVAPGPNTPIQTHDLERAIGPDMIDDLMQRTGLSRAELLERLSRELPSAIDRYTPEGRL